MVLIADMERQLETEESYFRQHLLKEDIARLRELDALARKVTSIEDFRNEAMSVGWTQSDMRTHHIRPAVETFLDAFYAWVVSDADADADERMRSAWQTFDRERMEKLIRCL